MVPDIIDQAIGVCVDEVVSTLKVVVYDLVVRSASYAAYSNPLGWFQYTMAYRTVPPA